MAHAVYVATRLGVADLMAGISEGREIDRRTGTRTDLMRRCCAPSRRSRCQGEREDTFELTCVG